MKKIYIIGYRGTRVEKFKKSVLEEGTLPILLYLGHVGIGTIDGIIFGFRPTNEAVRELASKGVNVTDYLKANNQIQGTLYDDTEYFVLANSLAEEAGTHVFQMAIELKDDEYDKLINEIRRRHSERETHWYQLPQRDINQEPLPMEDGVDNCATYPRTLGLPIPENTGTLADYIEVMKQLGEFWKPEGE